MRLKDELKEFNTDAISMYEAYLDALEKETDKDNNPKNYWFKSITKDQFANAFKQVHNKTNLFIDGESVTLNYRKKLIVTFDYHAYKNTVKSKYPETVFDFAVVYSEDVFSFKKASGRVIYNHEIVNPFAINKKIVGAYGIVKNSQGEFIELLNMDDIQKMKNTSTMKSIWDAWFDRMVLKSVIKRICSIHFHDLTESIMEFDNQSEAPENATIDDIIQKEIEAVTSEDQLTVIYKKYKSDVVDHDSFVSLLADKKHRLNDNNS